MPPHASDLLRQLASPLAETALASLWQGLVLAAATALALRVLSRWGAVSAAVRCAVWAVVFAMIAAIPLARFASPAIAPGAVRASLFHLAPSWGLGLTALWAIMTAVRLAQLLTGIHHLHRLWTRAQPVPADPALQALLAHGGRNAELCTTSDREVPGVIGFLRPRLLIPEALLDRLTAPELQHIVLHECEHLRRRDDWVNLAQKVALVLFPLNPALLWADRRLALERELACDAGVVAATAQPLSYAGSLTRLAEHRLGRRSAALALSTLALSAWSRRSELACRVHVLVSPVRHASPAGSRAALALLLLGLGIGSVELVRAPRLISFGDPAPAEASISPSTLIIAGKPAPDPSSWRNPVHAVPVVYHVPAAEPRTSPLRTLTLPSSSRPPASRPLPGQHANRPHRLASAPGLPSPATPRAAERPRLLLTAAPEAAPRAPGSPRGRYHARLTVRTVYTLSTDLPSSYAAVPFLDGWLILQL